MTRSDLPDEMPAAPASTDDAFPSRRALRAQRSGRASAAPRPVTRSKHPLRKRLGAAGAMLAVGGLFAPLTIPAYAASSFDGEPVAAAPASQAQTIRVAAATAEAVAAAAATPEEARDTYDSTSASDLRSLYRDGLKQRNLEAYLLSGAKELGDDYPWATDLSRSQGGGLSPLNYYVRECVDFVAWRLNRDAGSTSAPYKWAWSSLTPGAGSARSWKSQWEKHGWPISNTPAPGWVAWFPGANHVAYVSGLLGDGSVVIEEYNWGPELYNQRIIQASEAIYLSPPPQ